MAESYDDHRAKRAEVSRRRSAEGREIGPLPAVADPARKNGCLDDLGRFALTYFPARFPLPFGDDHRLLIADLQRVVLDGGQVAVAFPRGGGKTTLAECAALWAVLYGHRRFVMLIGATEGKAGELLDSVKAEVETNDRLAADFPEACHPVRMLEGINNRASGQTLGGERTRIEWTNKAVCLPTVPGAACSGAVVQVAGITGSVRGAARLVGGAKVRPDLVIVDDPQTDEALDIDTPIPTPAGFVRMGDLRAGDEVFDESGAVCRVTATSDVMFGRPCYRVAFDDGCEVVADAGHKWLTSTTLQRTNLRRRTAVRVGGHWAALPQCQPQPTASVRTTEQIAATLAGEGGRLNHSVPLAGRLAAPAAPLPIPPYTLGVWLGDGDRASGRITTADPELLAFVRADGFSPGPPSAKRGLGGRPSRAAAYTLRGLRGRLRLAGLLGDKHVPAGYLFAAPQQRLALLQGLMDTDGHVSVGRVGVKGIRCSFHNTNRRLIDAVVHLCRSLGIKVKTAAVANRTKPGAAPAWVATFITSVPVFRLSRKLARLPAVTRPNTRRRFVAAVAPVESRPVRCIAVDSPSHLYLCGTGLIPTHNSARSPAQVLSREAVLNGAVLGLAGPGVRIAAVMPCTVVRRGDLADRALDRERNPAWAGRRSKLLARLPDALGLWDRYGELLRDGLRADPPDRAAATAFYRANRAAMDAGAVATWPARYDPGQLSAVQFGMDLYLTKPEVFAAEFQGEPLDGSAAGGGAEPIDPVAFAGRVNRVPRGVVPAGLARLTAGVDVQGEIAFWVVCGWRDDFTGAVVDYGTFPPQPVSRFSAADPPVPLSALPALAGVGAEARVFAGVSGAVAAAAGRTYRLEDADGGLAVERCAVDAGNWADTVREACRRCPEAARVVASKGAYVGARRTPFAAWKPQPGERAGPGYKFRPREQWLTLDTNHFKTLLAERTRTPDGAAGALHLFGASPAAHHLFCDHLAAETPIRVTADGRTVDEWELRPGRPDNHWLDALVYAAAAAASLGVAVDAGAAVGHPRQPPAPRPRVRLSDLQKRKPAGAR